MLENNLHPGETPPDLSGLGRFAALGIPLSVGAGGELELDMEPAADVDTVIAQMLGAIHAAQLAGRLPPAQDLQRRRLPLGLLRLLQEPRRPVVLDGGLRQPDQEPALPRLPLRVLTDRRVR